MCPGRVFSGRIRPIPRGHSRRKLPCSRYGLFKIYRNVTPPPLHFVVPVPQDEAPCERWLGEDGSDESRRGIGCMIPWCGYMNHKLRTKITWVTCTPEKPGAGESIASKVPSFNLKAEEEISTGTTHLLRVSSLLVGLNHNRNIRRNVV